MEYVMYRILLIPSKKYRELPDTLHEYISHTSDIGWHFDYTKNIQEAYRFDESQMDEMKGYCDLLDMKYKTLYNV